MKAISPVIATVIIVSVAIALAIAVALWITGVIGGLSKMERLDITAAYYNRDVNIDGTDCYEIVIEISNKGSVATTIDRIFVNNKPVNPTYGQISSVSNEAWNATCSGYSGCTLDTSSGEVTLQAGGGTEIRLYLAKGQYISGQVVQIIVHTATGGEYPTQVTLP